MNFFIGAFCFLGNLYIMKKFEFLCSFPCGETEGFIYLDVSLMNKISEHEDDHHIHGSATVCLSFTKSIVK